MADFCILIPTINRADLLMEALREYPSLYPSTNIIILDSGSQDIPESINYKVLKSERRMGVAASWNYLIKYAIPIGHENFLVLNDDIILKTGESQISDLIEKHDSNTFIRSQPFYNWSAYILRKSIFEKVGDFDENFVKCFFEDNDYEYRMKLNKVNILYSEKLNADVYRNSSTIQKEPLLGDYIANQDYYIGKWGGIPGYEIYLTPQNR
jgi:GT2 family glycosyltransferase